MKFILLLISICLLTGCSAPQPLPHSTVSVPETAASSETEPFPTQPADSASPAAACLACMTTRQKIGQLFIVPPQALAEDSPYACSEEMLSFMQSYPPGGIVQFYENIQSAAQITEFNQALQQASPIPLLIATDEEGGRVARLAGHRELELPRYPSAAAAGSREKALEMGMTIGNYLYRFGFNMDFAPVADVNTNPQNPVIGDRSFSDDPITAALYARAMADGLTAQGIIPVFKHFPGHGDTVQDSHKELALSAKTKDQLSQCEWIPFQNAAMADGIMVGHIALPAVTGDNLPASLNAGIVRDILQEEIGFQGLIITDAMNMEAITDQWEPGEAALMALQAGCHMILIPPDYPKAFQAIEDALNTGALTSQELDAAVLKILEFKQAHGVLPPI